MIVQSREKCGGVTCSVQHIHIYETIGDVASSAIQRHRFSLLLYYLPQGEFCFRSPFEKFNPSPSQQFSFPLNSHLLQSTPLIVYVLLFLLYRFLFFCTNNSLFHPSHSFSNPVFSDSVERSSSLFSNFYPSLAGSPSTDEKIDEATTGPTPGPRNETVG